MVQRKDEWLSLNDKLSYHTPLYNFLKNKITHKALSNV